MSRHLGATKATTKRIKKAHGAIFAAPLFREISIHRVVLLFVTIAQVDFRHA